MPAADRSLDDIYRKERPNESERRNLLQQVAEALQYLHSKELVHGDVKKLNVVRVDNHLKLIDLDATTKKGQFVGCKFSSGTLPPELFYNLKSNDETERFGEYWKKVESANPDLWQKVKPREGFVVKTFKHLDDQLPYDLVEADPSLDVWAFGVLMFEMYSGEELVPTDTNQDVCERDIEQAGTWTQDNLLKRIRSKISNALVRSLLEQLLVIDPKKRMPMASVLDHVYFKDISHLFGPDMFFKLVQDPLTLNALGNIDFVENLLDIQHYPERHSLYAHDVRMTSVLSALNSKQPTTEAIDRAFGPDMIPKIAKNVETAAFLQDPSFIQKLLAIQKDVTRLPEHMNHPLMGKTVVALLYTPPDATIMSVAQLLACTRDTKHQWPLFGKFVLTTDVLTMPNDQQCIVRVTQNSNSSRKWVAKLSNKKNELDFIQHVHAMEVHKMMKEHIVNCETWGLVQFNDFKCYAVIMEEGKEDCKHRMHHIKSRVFNLIGCLSDIFNSIQACHDIGYIHGDIKLENIVFFSESERYKLIDFEQTTKMGSVMQNSCTEEYCPPEMAKFMIGRDKSPLCAQKSYDVWCAAVIVLKLFSENRDLVEFQNIDESAILATIAEPSFSFQKSIEATTLSEEAKKLLTICLCTDSSMRGTVHDLAKILEYQAKAELLHLVKDKPADDVDIDETGENTHLKETECDVTVNGKKENGRGPILNEMEMTPSTGAKAK
ncbi:Aste57867_20852 [Aphanomyces stellatus]|uniref:Aste57867_20852 protein n=1 Tax=Aphanomyces stellatus TaxID=120398 RepID=A0A485LG48_9STRA|nr:hypothetical protein As57867_020784 [Aphanomyces stellatus]VFT97530.1 Aste57867_20852 [Aphanomyces stellatus]